MNSIEKGLLVLELLKIEEFAYIRLLYLYPDEIILIKEIL